MAPFFVLNPPMLQPQSSVQDVKTRLDWGEPALTIIDVRDRSAFNQSRIQGAISMPLANLVEAVSSSLEKVRDIYVYGDTDVMTAEAANQLRDAGFQQVAELLGGLSAWRTARYPVEGI